MPNAQVRASSHEFDSFFHAWHGDVFRYARRRAPQLAEDVTAETFAIAWRRWYDIPPGRELPWLYGVARRVLRNMRRSELRQERVETRLSLVRQGANREDAGERSVSEALEQIDPLDREILLLLAWEGLSPREIAVSLGMTGTNVRVRLFRARRRLAPLLQAAASSSNDDEPSKHEYRKEQGYA